MYFCASHAQPIERDASSSQREQSNSMRDVDIARRARCRSVGNDVRTTRDSSAAHREADELRARDVDAMRRTRCRSVGRDERDAHESTTTTTTTTTSLATRLRHASGDVSTAAATATAAAAAIVVDDAGDSQRATLRAPVDSMQAELARLKALVYAQSWRAWLRTDVVDR